MAAYKRSLRLRKSPVHSGTCTGVGAGAEMRPAGSTAFNLLAALFTSTPQPD
jgi:hypothetical protein